MAPAPPCGNPLFLSWVEELRDEARAKGVKSAETYTKACNSIKKCPVVYSRPRELISLAAVGPKTVQILETRYKKYCEENGLANPGSVAKKRNQRSARGNESDDPEDPDPDSPSRKKTRKPSNKPAKAYVPQKGSGGYGILLALVLAIEDPERNTQVFLTKGEIIRAAQKYCDSSYDHSERGSYFTAWSSMKNLVGKGYVYVTGNPHKHCLTEEGYDVALVIRNLRPEFAHLQKYPFLHEPPSDFGPRSTAPLRPSLTQATSSTSSGPGSAAVSKPKYYNPYPDEPQPQLEIALSKQGKNARRPGLSNRLYSDDEEDMSIVARPGTGIGTDVQANVSPFLGLQSSAPPKNTKFEFWYIDSTGNRTPSLTSAAVRLDPEDFVNIRKVEFRSSQRSHPFVTQLKLVDDHPRMRDTTGQPTLFAYIIEEGAPPMCSKFRVVGQTNGHPIQEKESVATAWSRALSPTKVSPSADSVRNTGIGRTVSLPLKGEKRPHDSTTAKMTNASAGPSRSHSTSGATELSKSIRQGPRLSSHIPTLNPLLDNFTEDADSPDNSNQESHSKQSFTFSPSDALIFPAGSYGIILILDTREVESQSNRDKIAETLLAKGVKVETRALKLGDMCWIARRHDGLGGEEDECVLDYVAERKRLDDLCSSIRDGRYTEQCFRLTSSCINHVYYIVEDWQVTNRFFLKETHKLAETIDFLATMTSVIQSIHAASDLHVIPTRHLSRASYSALQAHLRTIKPDQQYLTSFQAYQDLNDKSGSRTLREKFARMILSVKGMSAERVSAVLEIWETPRELWEALKAVQAEGLSAGGGDNQEESETQIDVESQGQSQNQSLLVNNDGKGKGKGKKNKVPTVRGPEMIFAERIKGEGRRKIGDALSKDLYNALMG